MNLPAVEIFPTIKALAERYQVYPSQAAKWVEAGVSPVLCEYHNEVAERFRLEFEETPEGIAATKTARSETDRSQGYEVVS